MGCDMAGVLAGEIGETVRNSKRQVGHGVIAGGIEYDITRSNAE